MNFGKYLDKILTYLVENPELNNINAYTIQKKILDNRVSLVEANNLLQLLQESSYVTTNSNRFIGVSQDTENFLQSGGFQKLFPEHSEIIAMSSNSDIKIFLSYCWKQEKEAQEVHKDLSQIGVTIKKDDHVLRYKDSIHDYMSSIRTDDFALVLISEDFLKSRNCMNEMIHISKEQNAWVKILPVIVDGTVLYRPKDRLAYIKYWEDELKDLQEQITNLPPYKSLSLHEEIKVVAEISMMIDTFLSTLVKEKNVYLSDLKESGYKELHEKIGVENLSYAFNLLEISFMNDAEERELALSEYSNKFPINGFYWGIMAATAKMSKRFRLAKEYYIRSIELSPDNIASLNNLGMLYLEYFKDFTAARDCFQKVLNIDEKHTISRLNLGVVYTELGERGKAFLEYSFILTYDPKNAQAHCNIGNYYRMDNINHEKAEEHYKLALDSDPTLPETYLNYGNFLKNSGKLEEGNELYKRLLKLDIRDDVREAVQTLLKSNKG
ncbi:MAG: TIR domain-containing protein [Flavipsychrobacter sp.]